MAILEILLLFCCIFCCAACPTASPLLSAAAPLPLELLSIWLAVAVEARARASAAGPATRDGSASDLGAALSPDSALLGTPASGGRGRAGEVPVSGTMTDEPGLGVVASGASSNAVGMGGGSAIVWRPVSTDAKALAAAASSSRTLGK